MRPRRPNASALCFLLLALSPALAAAQPGNERENAHLNVKGRRKSIAAVGRRIADAPHDAQLYAERASLYIKLYRDLYEDSSGRFYGDRPPELGAAAIATNAIADLDRAIGAAPSAELYERRGEMFEARWNETVKVLRRGEWESLISRPGDSWTALTRPPTEGRELDAFGSLVTDADFASAVRDYLEALHLNRETGQAERLHAKLARLYLSRQGALPYLALPSIRKAADGANSYGYTLWADIDKALEHLAQSGAAWERLPWRGCHWICPRDYSPSRVYYYKASIAVTYGKHDAALEAFNAAEKYSGGDEYFACQVHLERGKVYAKTGDFDAAVREAGRVIKPGTPAACASAHVPRADAHFAKGDWRAAVADYDAAEDLWKRNDSLYYAYKNRGLAYAQLGETEKALGDLGQYIYKKGGEPELYRLRARLYRKLGKEDLALAEERWAEASAEDERARREDEYILGEIQMPDGVAFDKERVDVVLLDPADSKVDLWFMAGDDRRFIARYRRGRTFRIIVDYDDVQDGRRVRLTGSSGTLTVNGTVGPITIKLERAGPKG